MHPYEAILRMCAAAWPKPWYARAYAQSAGIPQQQLYYYIENLWLDGLVQKAEGSAETGPGLTLTAAGRDVLEDPAALARLKEGRAVKPGDQGGVVREALRRRDRPRVTLALVAVNVAAFLYTVYVASQMGIAMDYVGLSPFGGGNAAAARSLETLIKQVGAVYGEGWLAGQWWRLLTSCFIHIGALHILANMYALYRVGGEIERWWGGWRYLVIYLFAGLGGSVLALGLQPLAVMAGASGAICGVLGAAAVWVLCNGRHLPRTVAGQLRSNLIINAVLITFISLMPGVSWAGHLGGAVVGAAVALVMQVQRFGPSPWRWAVLGVLAVLPLLGWWFINHERHTNPAWQQVAPGARNGGAGRNSADETKEFTDNYLKRIRIATQAAWDAYHDAEPQLRPVPPQRDADKLPRIKRALAEQKEGVAQLSEELTKEGSYTDADVEEARQTAAQYTGAARQSLGVGGAAFARRRPVDGRRREGGAEGQGARGRLEQAGDEPLIKHGGKESHVGDRGPPRRQPLQPRPHALHHRLRRGSAGCDADHLAAIEPLRPQLRGVGDEVRRPAQAAGQFHQLAAVVAVGAAHHDHHVRPRRQLPQRPLTVLGRLADGVDEAHVRVRESRPQRAH